MRFFLLLFANLTMNFDRHVLIVPLGPIIIEPASPRNSLQILLVTFESTHILVLAADDPVAVCYIAIFILFFLFFFNCSHRESR